MVEKTSKVERFRGVRIPKGIPQQEATRIYLKTLRERPCKKWSFKTKWQHDVQWPVRPSWQAPRYGQTLYGHCKKCDHYQSNRC